MKEVKANFAPEIVKAFENNEKYTRIDSDYADCIKINDLGKKYGVSTSAPTFEIASSKS